MLMRIFHGCTVIGSLPWCGYLRTTQSGRLHSTPPLPYTHLDFLAVDVDQPLPEVHADRGLRLAGEPAGAEAVGEARLADAGVADHDDLKDAGPGRWELAGVGQGAWESQRRAALCHLTAGLNFQKLPSSVSS